MDMDQAHRNAALRETGICRREQLPPFSPRTGSEVPGSCRASFLPKGWCPVEATDRAFAVTITTFISIAQRE